MLFSAVEIRHVPLLPPVFGESLFSNVVCACHYERNISIGKFVANLAGLGPCRCSLIIAGEWQCFEAFVPHIGIVWGWMARNCASISIKWRRISGTKNQNDFMAWFGPFSWSFTFIAKYDALWTETTRSMECYFRNTRRRERLSGILLSMICNCIPSKQCCVVKCPSPGARHEHYLIHISL